MKKQTILLLLLSLMIVSVLSACGILQEPEKAGGPIEAIPLAEQPTGAEGQQAASALEGDPAVAPGSGLIFTIDPAGSQVRFELDEDLRGVRNTVIGVTDQVAGQLSVDLSDLSQTQVGAIQINARALETDSNLRNRTMQNEILKTREYEFITFTPTGVQGLPASAAVGETVTFTILGDLTIRDITMPVTFSVEAKAASETQLTGTASAIVNRTDFGLQIPSVPSVANVEEEVELYIDFTANAS